MARRLHLARMLKEAGGIPSHGNQRSEWDAGCRFEAVLGHAAGTRQADDLTALVIKKL